MEMSKNKAQRTKKHGPRVRGHVFSNLQLYLRLFLFIEVYFRRCQLIIEVNDFVFVLR